ncbi:MULTISPECIES: geranylgeranyl reductase family protein [Mameliella]|uniref:geranylgeranyl reductase family protein n=1 Tax=Mameliella TaxID=1434019 RepID=UPI000B52D091|nr:geranylgeranyl reductase family protein [Mameliella alba]MCR9273051.1 geranylgeranyl reductase family protein [Paracoccaceae bacterium]OWV56086.1 geranylgeranyl reductase [Mameliella alba]
MTGGRAQASGRFDLIVLGAGPAGSAAAMSAIQAGLRVALVDKARFPRNKLCGGGLTGRAISRYRQTFGGTLPPVPLERRDMFTFHAYGQPLGDSRDAPPLHLGMRYELDAALVEQALAAGAVDFTGQSGRLDPDGPALDLPGGRIEAPLMIAADGVNSPTARTLFGAAFDRARIGFALEVEHPGTDPDRPLRIDFGAADWGYGWQFPKPRGTTVGLGGVMSRNANMKAGLARYLDQLGLPDTLPVKGQFLPFGDFRAVPGKGRILLAGDAAGLVDPITGEGIAHALDSGALAARAACRALEDAAPDKALAAYTNDLRPIHRGLRHARLLRNLMFRETLRPAFIRSFRSSRTLRGEYLRMMAGETDYGPLMQKMAARLPGFAWRAVSGT